MEFTFTEEQIAAVAGRVLEEKENKILAFYGPMGAGKTTFIKAMIRRLGAQDAGSSPTFGLVNEYHDARGRLLAYHFDFYRIEDETEALDLGFEDYLDQDAWIFVEWPERIPNLLPETARHIELEVVDPTTRTLRIS